MSCEQIATNSEGGIFLQRSIGGREISLPLLQVPSGVYIAYFDPEKDESLVDLGALSIYHQLSHLMSRNGNEALCVVTPPSRKSVELVTKGVKMLDLGEEAVVIVLRGGKKEEHTYSGGLTREYTPITGRRKIIEVNEKEIGLVREILERRGALFVFGDDVYSSGATHGAANDLFESFLGTGFHCAVAVGREGDPPIPDSGEGNVFYEIKLPVISGQEIEEQLKRR